MELGYALGHGWRAYLESAGDRGRGSRLYLERGAERFAGIITVPGIASGRVRWLSGRAVDSGATPRFQGMPGPKPALGVSRLGPAPEFVILTEGVFEYLALSAWGYRACAALGSQGADKVASALRGCPRIFLVFGNYGAGVAAAEGLKGLVGRRAAVVNLP